MNYVILTDIVMDVLHSLQILAMVPWSSLSEVVMLQL